MVWSPGRPNTWRTPSRASCRANARPPVMVSVINRIRYPIPDRRASGGGTGRRARKVRLTAEPDDPPRDAPAGGRLHRDVVVGPAPRQAATEQREDLAADA